MKYVKKTLSSGLRVIAVPVKDSLSVTVLILVEAGSKYEHKEISGLSHFLEHMCFKGTVSRPRPIDISIELDSIGTDYNAFTSQEYTAYYVKSHPKHLEKILRVAADLYMNPILDEKEIEKEKGVVIEEINMYEDTPNEQIWEEFSHLLYGDQPAGWPVLGTKETVRNLTKKDIVEYRRKHYVAEATTVVVAGNFDQKHVFREVSEIFKGMSAGRKHGKKKVKETQRALTIKIKKKESEQLHLALGVRAIPLSDRRACILRVMNSVLGGGMSSRLWQKIRMEMGAAYYVYPYYKPYSDHGFFAVFAGVDAGRGDGVLRAIIEEFKRLKGELVPEEELKKAKDYLLGQIYLGLESSDELAVYYGAQEVMRQKLQKPAELAKEIRRVTAEDIRELAREIFVDKRLNLALIGKNGDEKKLRSIIKL